MITRFSTLSEAVLFAAQCREEGHFAEVVHLNAGHLWGPQPDWGIAVVHSEETGDEEAGAAPEIGWLPPGMNRAAAVILALAAVAGSAFLVVALLGILSALASMPAFSVVFLSRLAVAACALVATVALGHLVIRAHRAPEPVLHRIVLALCAVVGWLLVVLVF
jgi:hypothetical protein